MFIRALLFALTLSFASAASATTVLSEDFSGGLNGWTTLNGDVQLVSDGGPDGTGDAFFASTDTTGGSGTEMTTVFGAGWSGDLSAYNRGTLSFDFAHSLRAERLSPTASLPAIPDLIGSFGRIYVTSAAGVHPVVDTFLGTEWLSEWRTTSIRFDATTFRVSEADWASILANVTNISLRLESWAGIDEVVGLDNVALTPVPLPAALPMMVLAFGTLGMVRARAKRRLA